MLFFFVKVVSRVMVVFFFGPLYPGSSWSCSRLSLACAFCFCLVHVGFVSTCFVSCYLVLNLFGSVSTFL